MTTNVDVTGEPRPTAMNHFLLRVRLAETCREITDVVPKETQELAVIPYERIVELDGKLMKFIADLPDFLKLDHENRQRSAPLEGLYPHLPLLRFCLTGAAYGRRCKLHQRFLLRKASDRRFAFSRQACVESACTVIRTYEGLAGVTGFDGSRRSLVASVGIVAHNLYLATVVLVMDLCSNAGEMDQEELKVQVWRACKAFEEMKYISPLYERFTNALFHLLRKHDIDLEREMSVSGISSVMTSSSAAVTAYDDQLGLESSRLGSVTDVQMDSIWNADLEGSLDAGAWENLFSAADWRPL